MTPAHGATASVFPTLTVTALCAALMVAPGAWNGAFSGVGYSDVRAAALVFAVVVALALLVVIPRRRPVARVAALLGALIVIRAGIGIVDTPRGWHGHYTMETPAPPAVGGFAWRLASHPFRIDRDLRFQGPSFDLQFLNDLHRYNGVTFAPPRATSQALTFTWTGWFEARSDGALEVFAASAGPTRILLDDAVVVVAATTQPAVPPQVAVTRGWHRLTVVTSKPADAVPSLFVRLLHDGRPLEVRPWRDDGRYSPRLLGLIDDAVTLTGMAVASWYLALGFAGARIRSRSGAAGAGAALAAVMVIAVSGLTTAGTFAGRTYELRPGDDHLAYEGLARNIVAEGVLMPEGKARGQGTPFYFYPLYTYALAGLHLLLGDGYAVVVLLNATAATALPVCLWLLGWRHLGAGVQIAGQVALVAFAMRHNARYFESPLTDNLFIPLSMGALALGLHAVRSLRPLDAVATGSAIAVCATTRPSFFLFTGPFVIVLLAAARAQSRLSRVALTGSVLAGYALTLTPVILRNWIMSGQAVAMVTLAHAIPVSLIAPEMQAHVTLPQVTGSTWANSLRLAWDIIAADPSGVAWLELRKVLFTLGLTHLGPGAPPLIPEFPLLCVAAVLAVALGRLPWRTVAVLGAFLASHLAAIVIAYPWTYGYKTILPVQLVFLFCALHLLARQREAATDV